MKYVYKVVRGDAPNFHSAVISKGNSCLSYKLNEGTVEPNEKAPLFAFIGEAEARLFLQCHFPSVRVTYHILKCKCVPSDVVPPYLSPMDLENDDDDPYHYYGSHVCGTVFAKELTPIEIVDTFPKEENYRGATRYGSPGPILIDTDQTHKV